MTRLAVLRFDVSLLFITRSREKVPATGRVTVRSNEIRGFTTKAMFAVLLGSMTHAAIPVHATAASAVSVHDGMSLNALAAAVKRADIRICLTVTEHFGYTQP